MFLRFEVYFSKHKQDIFVSLLAHKTLRAIVLLFFSRFFWSSFSDGKFIPSQLYLFIKGLIFVILSGLCPIFLWFNATVTTYSKHFLWKFYCCFFVFYPVRRIYMWRTTIWSYFIPLILQKKNIIEEKLTTFHRFPIISILFFEWFKKFFYNFIFFIINNDSYAITFWIHCSLFIIIFRRNKINCSCWLDFPYLKLFMMNYLFTLFMRSFNYGNYSFY